MKRHANSWNWSTHALWLIGVLIAVICWLSLKSPTGVELRDYLGFAATIAALILSVIAIFQAIVSQHDGAEMISIAKSSLDDIRDAAANLSETSQHLLEEQKNVVAHVSGMPEEMARLSEKINEASANSSRKSISSKGKVEDSFEIIMKDSPFGIKLSLAILARSYSENYPIDIYRLIPENETYAIWVNGAIQMIRTTQPWGLEISAIRNNGQMLFAVDKLGKFEPGEIIHLFESVIQDPDDKNVWDSVDKYFKNKDRQPSPGDAKEAAG